jgi:hypothetical protein
MPYLPNNALVQKISSQIVSENEMRSGLFIRNMSNAIISLGFGCDAGLNKGIIIYPGEAYSMNRYDYSPDFISAISNQDNSLVAIQEFSDRIKYMW